MNKKLFALFGVFLLFTSVSSVMVKGVLAVESENLHFDYQVADGDDFDFFFAPVLDFNISSGIYDQLDDAVEGIADDLESMAGEPVLDDSISVEAFVNDVEDFVNTPNPINLEISDTYNWEVPDELYDAFEVDIRMGTDKDYPSVYAGDRLDELATMIEPYMAPDFYTNNFTTLVDEAHDELDDVDTDQFNDVPILKIYSFELEDLPSEITDLELTDGTEFPDLPADEIMAPQGFPFVLPDDTDLAMWYNWVLDVLQFIYDWADENGTLPSEISDIVIDDNVSISIDSFRRIFGATWDFQKRSICMSWAFEEVLWDDVEDFLVSVDVWNVTEDGHLDTNVEDIFNMIGIAFDTFSGYAGMAIEFDENFVISSYSTYVSGFVEFDYGTNSYLYNISTTNPDFPDLDGEYVGLTYGMNFYRQGVTPLTFKEIQEGKVGEKRGTDINLLDIPGYGPAALLIFTLLGVSAIVIRKRTH